MPLGYFQEVYAMRGAAHRVVAVCHSLDDVASTAAKMQHLLAQTGFQHLQVLDWKELTPGLLQAIQMDLIIGFIFYLILIVVVAFSILNTFLMAIFERTREFGVMMALGTTPGRITRLLICESAAMTLMGTAVGIAAGSFLTAYFQAHGITVPGAEEVARQFGLPERIYPQLSLLSVAIGAGIVLLITLATAVYPAFKVRRLTPVEALAAA
jgi:ABC-type lipoprotein release transport system permease subunit